MDARAPERAASTARRSTSQRKVNANASRSRICHQTIRQSRPPPMGRQQTTPLPSAVLPPADGESLLPKEERLNETNTKDYDLMYEPPAKPAITKVPDWLYTESGFFEASKAATLWMLNLICFVWHTVFLIISWSVSAGDAGGLSTPSLTVYTTSLEWRANQTDALIPSFVKTSGISLPALVITFFGLSALAHGTVVAFNYRQAFATGFWEHKFYPERAQITTWTGWYFVWMHKCNNMLRWLEYSFSAAVMALVFSVSGGISHVYMLTFIFGLIWCTMQAGLVSELLCPPKDLGNDVRPKYWLKNSTNPHLLWAPWLSGRFHRLLPHLAGFVPYLMVWICILDTFFYNTSDAPEGEGPPPFVYAIVIGQFVAFSLFGITQFVLLWREDGARQFFWGEVSYQFLSLFAKGLLGGVLVANVLLYQSFDEAVTRQQAARMGSS